MSIGHERCQRFNNNAIDFKKFTQRPVNGYKETGHCNIPRYYSKNQPLATWIHKQRSKYRDKKLAKEKISKLKDIGLILDPFKSIWEETYISLCEFKKKTGHCNVPRHYPQNQPLANWVRKQRSKYRDRKLSKERIIKLQNIGLLT